MDFDLSRVAPQLLEDPYPLYAILRETQPVTWVADLELFLVTRYADVRRVLSDPVFSADFRHGRSAMPNPPLSPQLEQLSLELAKDMLRSDGEVHRRRRSIVARAFTPRVVRDLVPRVEKLVQELLDDAFAAGRFDLMGEFAHALPIYVIGELLGLPPEDRRQIRAWSDDLIVYYDPLVPVETRGPAFARCAEPLRDYFAAQFAERRRQPREDLLSGMVRAAAEDRIGEDEILAQCVLIMLAGHETTSGLIGNAVLALDAQPDAREALVRDPARLPAAVEELLRFDSPVQMMQRQTVEATRIGDVEIPKAAVVIPVFAAANRDPEVFTNPDRLCFDRRENPHLAFGHGEHFCAGAHLARLEARLALAGLYFRGSELVVHRESLVRKPSVFVRGLTRLEVSG